MSLDQLLESLRTDYIAQLPKKISNILAQIENGQSDDLRESFHKLKGTGKTYGLPEISTVAEVVEEICIHTPETAVQASALGVELLKDIYSARQSSKEFPIDQDPRLHSLRKLLPNGLTAR